MEEEEDAEVRRTSHDVQVQQKPNQARVVLWTWRVSLSSRKEG